ncbi:glutamate decarboxylase [Yersinia enterocolitica]|uniref:Glutamate decarboxylase n=1 Tax=Yersinia enterocolitica TaxID=630 RepID=A0ABM9S3X9_YEREN|nr:glutamate decarboxylase [Yersinia enterocolitica]CQD73416.1 glutamate decarboxylase [Yersinia enterocolitica]CRX86305.1 glutamate decarboxylase [Yersinia enterocolitica]
MTRKSLDDYRSTLLDSRFGSQAIRNISENKEFPKEEMREDIAFQIISDELFLDGNARQNLATFCQTWDDDNVHKLMDLSINKNWIDKEEYPQSAAIDLRCVNMMADLWNAPTPKGGQGVGTNTIGSSEACMLGGMAMKWRWRKKMEVAGKPTNKPNFVCGPVQICWHKFARYWDVEIREIPMIPGQLFMDPKRMIEACDENTIGVVPTFGVTYTGNYELPKPLHEALDKLQKDTGLDIDMHIDAASGGFLAPFVAPDIEWDFRLPRVKSISTSGHKFGLAPLGCGWVIWRDAAALPEELIFNVDYLGGQIGTFAINFSRPAGQVISQYYEFIRLGREGYTKVQSACYQVAEFLAKEIAPLGPYEFYFNGNPNEGIPAICFRIKEGAKPGYTLYDLSERLRLRGWQFICVTVNQIVHAHIIFLVEGLVCGLLAVRGLLAQFWLSYSALFHPAKLR